MELTLTTVIQQILFIRIFRFRITLIFALYLNAVKALFLGSSCIYAPKAAKQPITEEELLNGHLEATNEPYAIAKIAGIKMCQSYLTWTNSICNFFL